MPILSSTHSHAHASSTPRSATSLGACTRTLYNERSKSSANTMTNIVSPAYFSADGKNSCVQEQVVVGITASAEDEVEDWTNDFRLERTPARYLSAGSENVDEEIDVDVAQVEKCSERQSSAVPPCSFKNEQRIFPVLSCNYRSYYAEEPKILAEENVKAASRCIENEVKEELSNIVSTVTRLEEAHVGQLAVCNKPNEEEKEEDWDIEFGFVDTENVEFSQSQNCTSNNGLDLNRRRSENFNIFIKAFHDMMDGEDIGEDEEEQNGLPKNNSKSSSEEKFMLFQRRRNESQSIGSADGHFSNTSNYEYSSAHSGTTRPSIEYTLSDRFRLLDIACSSAYSIRIERFPKPCTTYSQLESPLKLPSFSDAKFERWLQRIAIGKCKSIKSHLDQKTKEKVSIVNILPKNVPQSFKSDISSRLHKHVVLKVTRALMLCRYRKDFSQSRMLMEAFFDYIKGLGLERSGVSPRRSLVHALGVEEYAQVSFLTVEILQEAARLYGPNATDLVKSSKDHERYIGTFQSFLRISQVAFPGFAKIIALIEIRYVCFHLILLVNATRGYNWITCTQLAPVAYGEVAEEHTSVLVYQVLYHYGELLSSCIPLSAQENSVVTRESELETAICEAEMQGNVASFCALSTNRICLQALVLCDIQHLHNGISSLVEQQICGLSELVDLDPEDGSVSSEENKSEQSACNSGQCDEDDYLNDGMDEASGSQLIALIRQESDHRRILLSTLYDQISHPAYPLIKAKCAIILASLHSSNLTIGHLRTPECLAYEALCLLEFGQQKNSGQNTVLHREKDRKEMDDYLTFFTNNSLLSEFGRESLETLGTILIYNQKYRYGIRCLEAACTIYEFLHHGTEHARLKRRMCALTLEADDVKRAIPLHENVAKIAKVHGNINEFVYLTQVLVGLWIRQGHFMQTEKIIETALQFIREHCGILPTYFTEIVAEHGSSAGTNDASFSSRSSNFNISTRSLYSGEFDSWLNHDVSLHLMLRDAYRSSGRYMKAMRVLEHILNNYVRLPRGKRTNTRMLLAEDALKNKALDTCYAMLQLLEQEATIFHEKYRDSSLCSSTGAGHSHSSTSRSIGIGTEGRFCHDMVVSTRYIVCRAKLHLERNEYLQSFAWLALARSKAFDKSLRFSAKLHSLEGRVCSRFFQELIERNLASQDMKSADCPAQQTAPAQSASCTIQSLKCFSGSLYVMTAEEQAQLQERIEIFNKCLEDGNQALTFGVQAFRHAYEHYRTLDDSVYQIKMLLAIVQLRTESIRQSLFAAGSHNDEKNVSELLQRALCYPGTAAGRVSDVGLVQTPLEIAQKCLRDSQKLLRSALLLTEQIASIKLHLYALIYCAETWIFLDIVAERSSERHLKEAGACWEEAVRIMKAVYFRRVMFIDHEKSKSIGGNLIQNKKYFGIGAVCELANTFSMVPILNFSERFVECLESWLMSLIWSACLLMRSDKLPSYLEHLIATHLDELLSARMGVGSILHQLRMYRMHEVFKWTGIASSSGCSRVSSSSAIQNSFIESPRLDEHLSSPLGKMLMTSPSTTSSSGSSARAPSTTKRKRRNQHRKNLSMSSISELLASNATSAPSSFHDASYSHDTHKSSVSGSVQKSSPRTGLAYFGCKRSSKNGDNREYIIKLTTLALFDKNSESSTHSSSTKSSRVQASTYSTPRNGPHGEDYANRSGVRHAAHSHHNLSGLESSTVNYNEFDEVQAAKLWFIFSLWSHAKSKYCKGNWDITNYRYQNLKTLRSLIDAFDSQQVALLHRRRDSAAQSSVLDDIGLQDYDVAHLNSHALLQYRNFALSIGYDATRASYDYSQFKFKIFRVSDGDTLIWREQIPRPEWYMTHYDNSEADSSAVGQGILRTMRLLGAKNMIKILGSILLETPLIVIGSSFPQIKDVTLSLIKLLQPFQWPHVFVPFLPVTSWRFLYDSLRSYLSSHHKSQPRHRKSSHMRWGSSSNLINLIQGAYMHTPTDIVGDSVSATPRTSDKSDAQHCDSPFVIGILTETWEACVSHIMLSADGDSIPLMTHKNRFDERTFSGAVNIIDLDNINASTISKGSFSFPRKWQKYILERFGRAVKHTRRLQQKSARQQLRRHHMSSALDRLHIPRRSHYDHQIHSASHWISSNVESFHSQIHSSDARTKSSRVERNTLRQDSDERCFYNFECNSVLRNGVYEIYEKLVQCCIDSQRKKSKQKSKRSVAKQEIKSWFSSSHEIETFVEKFMETRLYLHYQESMRERGMLPLPCISSCHRAPHASVQLHSQYGRGDTNYVTASQMSRWGSNSAMTPMSCIAPMTSAVSHSSSCHSHCQSGLYSNPSSGRNGSSIANPSTITI